MATRLKRRLLYGLNPQVELEIVLGYLNGDAKYVAEWSHAASQLKWFMEKWNASKQNMSRFIRNNPKLWEAIEKHCECHPPQPFPSYPDEDGLELMWRLPAVVLRSLRSEKQDLVALSEMLPISPEALHLFISFLLNPLRHRVGGPCPRCGRYFLRRTNRNPKVYCSRNCGLKTTAQTAMKARRHKERNQKLQRVQEALQEWTDKNRTDDADWKTWVSGRVLQIDPKLVITPNFLTHAVKRGEVKEPSRKKRRGR